MGKATSMLFAAIGFGTASYVMFVPDMDQAASEKLASLVRIGADGSRAVALSRAEREPPRGQASRQMIADKETSLAPAERDRPVLAQATSNSDRAGTVQAPPAVSDGQRRSTIKPVDEESRQSLARSIQAELKRVGCFDGEADGVWNTPTRNALKTFVERINATLPVNEPDYILLTLLQGHTNRVCGKGCPTGQVLANDGRCQPKVIVAQAERKVPRREPNTDTAGGNQRMAAAQVAPDVVERERQAQVRAVEEQRGKAAADEARRRQEQQAKAETERSATAERERLAQAKVAAVAEEARQKQAALAEQQRAKDEAGRVAAAIATEQQRVKAESARNETRQRQAALEEQQLAKANAERLADARAAEEQRVKAAALAEEARRKQLIAEEQKRTRADAERLAAARSEADARIKSAAAAEETRRKQLIAEEQQRSKAEAERLAALRVEEERRVKAAAAAEDARRKQIAAEQKNMPPNSGNDPARVAAAVAPIMQPQILANVIPNSVTVPTPPVPEATPSGTQSMPFTTGSTNLPAVPVEPSAVAPMQKSPQKAEPGRKAVARPAQRQQNADPAPRPQPRYVQRFIPPPSYVGRLQAPSPAPRPTTYQAPEVSNRGNVFHNISRNAP